MSESFERSVIVRVRDGLHARPAAQLVKLARSFTADVQIQRNDAIASARSSVKLMLLGVKEGDTVIIRAEGDDATAAIDGIAALFADDGEAPHPAALFAQLESGPDGPAGIGASEGIAIGAAFLFRPASIDHDARFIEAGDRHREVERFRDAMRDVIAAIEAGAAAAHDRAIVEALIEIARDGDLTAAIETEIGNGADAVTAVSTEGGNLARRFEMMDDTYLKARSEDINGLVRAVTLHLLGRADPSLAAAPRGAIVVADELNAWDFARVDIARFGGILCRQGGATAHAAIMARTLGVPAVFGCAHLPDIVHGTEIAIDGGTGAVYLTLDDALRQRLMAGRAQAQESRLALLDFRDVHPVTRAGKTIHVAANLGSTLEIKAAIEAGAMGVGLFRTELLFIERRRPLTEDEQAAIYQELAQAFAPNEVIVRTLDIGGDKPIPGIDIPAEDNPFLGWRGLRLCLDRPDLFKPQLRALLRAAVHGNLKIMLPMVAESDEILRARAMLETCRAELAAAGTPHAMPALGVMIETPAAALMADDLARHAAFFSIGTNDLVQYVMAADRLNPRVAAFNRPDHPAVLRAIELTCRAAAKARIPVGVCGEAASSPTMIPILLGLGVDELSMSPAAILRAKKIIGTC